MPTTTMAGVLPVSVRHIRLRTFVAQSRVLALITHGDFRSAKGRLLQDATVTNNKTFRSD